MDYRRAGSHFLTQVPGPENSASSAWPADLPASWGSPWRLGPWCLRPGSVRGKIRQTFRPRRMNMKVALPGRPAAHPSRWTCRSC